MKAVVVHQYGGPEVLKFEEYPDPVPSAGEVLVRVAATSVNPIDYKRRAGLTKDFYPLKFPGLIGVVIAGTVVKIGPGAEEFSAGDQVFAIADNTYAELCVVKAATLAKVPKGLDLVQAAALPLVTTNWQPASLSYRNQSGQDCSRRRRCWECRAFGGIHCEVSRGDCDRGCFEETVWRREDRRRGPGCRNRRRRRDCESSAARCGGRYRRRTNRREADRQTQAGRSVCVGCRRAAERRGVSICKGRGSVFEIRQENARVHGRSGAGWQAGNPD